MSFTRSLIVQVSNRCPCYCPGCYSYFSEKEAETELVINFIKEFQKQFGIKKVTISGGDPLMRNDITKLLKKLNEIEIEVSIDTVGITLLNKIVDSELINELKKIKEIGIPLDGITDETIQLFRHGITFDDSIKVVKLLSEYGVNICINTVVHDKNVHELSSIGEVINKESAIKKWQLFQYMPIGPRGLDFADFFCISEEKFESFSAKVKTNGYRSSLVIQNKSLSSRKNKYLLVQTDGAIWYPLQSQDSEWIPEFDRNNDRIVLGKISDVDIIQKIKRGLFYEKV